jgi:hypothetical protein
MTILTLRRIREDRFEVTEPDIEPVTFKTRAEARDGALSTTRARRSGRLARRWRRPRERKAWSTGLQSSALPSNPCNYFPLPRTSPKGFTDPIEKSTSVTVA